jgi:hypothetical protein
MEEMKMYRLSNEMFQPKSVIISKAKHNESNDLNPQTHVLIFNYIKRQMCTLVLYLSILSSKSP